MREVYRAKDSKFGRDVAIKVLPDEFAKDEERLKRFQREAKSSRLSIIRTLPRSTAWSGPTIRTISFSSSFPETHWPR